MIASKFMDVVAGVDIHIQLVIVPPNPVPTLPTPLPTPFMGLVFDPATVVVLVLGDCKLATAICVAMDPIGAAVSYVADKIEGVSGGPVHINEVPASTTMTEPMQITPHPPTPPGLLFFPSYTPVLKGDACYNMGSSSVWMGGRRAVRTGMDPTFSCSQPIRLPSSQTMPVPLGAPVLIGGFPTPDLQAMISRAVRKAVTARIKSHAGAFRDRVKAFARPHLTAAIQRLPKGRLRTILAVVKCHITGDPVDVATGRMVANATDWELPGPIPLAFKRAYSSPVSDRDGVLGFGWSHTLDEEVWVERGRVVYRAGDGREIQFDTIHLPGRQMQIGHELFDPINRLWLRRTREGWDVANAEGGVHELRLVRGDRRTDRWRLSRVRSRDGHEIVLSYDERARLAWVRDSEARVIQFEHDRHDRLVCISLPHPTEPGFVPYVRYEYAPNGNLMAVQDAVGNVSRYDYSGHLMVQRTDRTGLSFYFGYDGVDASAYCVRTWGDGGIYDHALVYDKENRRTIVTNSLGATRVYEMDEALLVVKMIDAHGGVTEYSYDEQLRLVREVGPSGETVELGYDARGNCTRVVEADGAERRMEFDQRDLCTRIVEPLESEIRMAYDSLGRLVQFTDPLGNVTTLDYRGGRLTSIRSPTGATTRYSYDPAERVETVSMSNGGIVSRRLDRVGRVIEERDPRGAVRRFRYTILGDLEAVLDPVDLLTEYRYDAEGNLTEARTPNRHVRLTYGGLHNVVARESSESRLGFEYDTENRLVAVINELGERHVLTLDALGDASSETGFDGSTRLYVRDASGRATTTVHPSGKTSEAKYDAEDRLIEVTHGDGTFAKFEYDVRGLLVGAVSNSCEVKIERDLLGRVVRESQDGGTTWIRSEYGVAGRRHVLESDLGARQRIEFDTTGDVRRLHHRRSIDAETTIQFDRDALGLEIGRELPGGIRIEWSLDAWGRPIERRTMSRRVSAVVRGPAAAPVPPSLGAGAAAAPLAPLDARSYLWRGHEQIAALVNAATGPTLYDHDARGRLVRERQPTASRSVDRAMDAVGNIYRRSDTGDRRYDPGGVLLSANDVRYEHDADGNIVARVHGDGSTWRYRWEGTGLLSAVERPDGTVVRFEYDAVARRTRKYTSMRGENGQEQILDDTRFFWDGNTVLHELGSERGVTTWYWDPDNLAPVAKQSGDKTWSIAADYLGTPTEMYDDDGALAWQMTLDILGVSTCHVGTVQDCPWRWPGQYADVETALVYNRWRYYDPELGTYTSTDPYGLGGGWRAYGYPLDSLIDCDPFGLFRPFEVAPYGDSDHTGDGLDADELLGSIWLREHGYGNRRSAAGRQNPAIAIDPGLHRQITRAQREAGLFNHARVRRQSAMANIQANYDVRLRVLTAYYRSRGQGPAAAARLARRRLAPLLRDARRFAREHCGA